MRAGHALKLSKASLAERSAKVASRIQHAPSIEEFFQGVKSLDKSDASDSVPITERYPVPEVQGKSRRTTWREERLPKWLTYSVPRGDGQGNFNNLKKQLKTAKLATICQEGNCPNIGECWGGGKEGVPTATIMLMGDTCTRACRFCSVKTSKAPPPLDEDEPENTAASVASWDVGYIVMTMVDRDDLEDGGARHVAKTVQKIKEKTNNKMLVECLVGDFQGKQNCISIIAESGLDVYAHNIETVESQTPSVRDRRASYWQSLKTLEFVKKTYPKLITKSAIMLGVGEKEAEIRQALKDLRSSGVDCVTIGQYLQPNRHRMKVSRYADPKEFEQWKAEGEAMGFLYVASGPKVRSSYKAGEFFMENIIRKRQPAAASS